MVEKRPLFPGIIFFSQLFVQRLIINKHYAAGPTVARWAIDTLKVTCIY